jgi:hypothetical protein
MTSRNQAHIGFDHEDVPAREAIIRRLLDADLIGASGRAMSEGARAGVVELLLRISKVSGPTNDDRTFSKKAQVDFLAGSSAVWRDKECDARLMHNRKTVSGRTLSGRWAKDAIALGLLRRDVRSHQVGGTEWNVWTVDVAAVAAASTANVGPRPTTSDHVRPRPTGSDPVGPYKTNTQETKKEPTTQEVTEPGGSDFLTTEKEPTTSPSPSTIEEAERVANHPANRQHFRSSAGAARFFVANGRWPTSAVVLEGNDLDDWERQRERVEAKRSAERAQKNRERIEYEAAACRREQLRLGVPVDEVRRAIVDRFGQAMADRMVWSDQQAMRSS